MQEQEIPLLTEVHAFSEQPARPLSLNADLVAQIVDAIKPQLKQLIDDKLVEDIKHLVAQEINQAVISASKSLTEHSAAVVDKARADFATEIPQMLQANTEILKADLANALNQLQLQRAAEVQAATLDLQEKLTKLHEDLLSEHQTRLATGLAGVYQGLEQQSQVELNLYLEALQLKTKQQLALEIDEAFPALYQGLSDEVSIKLKHDVESMANVTRNDFKQQLNAELPSVEQALDKKVHEILDVEMPRIEQNLTQNIKAEIEKLLDSVRLIFNKKSDSE